MTLNISQHPAGARFLTILGLTFFLLPASSWKVEAATDQLSVVGTWTVQITLRDCTTNAPLGPPFSSLVTFHRDGTISESAGSVTFAPGQRSPGHGLWTPKGGHSFTQEMIALVLFDTQPNLPGTPTFDPARPVSPGFFAGWSTVTHTVRLTNAGEIESSGQNWFYKANGDLYRSGCSTATGQRF
jgi:hypothetical protein